MKSFKGPVTDVSIIQLIADPGRYENERVRLIGFLHLEFEGDALYLHREDHENAISQNAVWVDLPKWAGAECQRRVNDHYVLLEGVFHGADRGHMSMFSGAIGKLDRLEAWTPQANGGADADAICEPLPLRD
jgi:hypothetical protein